MQNNTHNNESKKFCLNCQTELHGEYCHVCGQHAKQQKPTVKEFILEYMNIAFVWDQHFTKTISYLLRKPGYLTNEYVSGKFVSYTHPLKLNMFLLFAFITLLLLFHSTEDMGNSVHTITRNEAVYPMLVLNTITEDQEYVEVLKSSELDTVKLYAPLLVSEEYPEIITYIDGDKSIPEDSMAVWTATVSHQLIEDKSIILHEDGYYYFAETDKQDKLGIQLLENILKQMIKLSANYFPLIILLTAPLLSLVVRILHPKKEHSQFKHFVFSLHYIAFLELVIIFLYILHLIASPPTWFMQSFILATSFIYLTLATKRVYDTKRWFVAAGQTLLTNIGYSLILMSIFFIIFIISIIIVAINYQTI